MTFFLETLVKLVEQGAKFQLKWLCHKLHLQSSDVSSTSLYRCRVFGLAGDAISSLFAVPLCSAQWCLQLGVFALLQFFFYYRKLMCNKQVIGTAAFRKNKVWNGIRHVTCVWSFPTEAEGRKGSSWRQAVQLFAEAVVFCVCIKHATAGNCRYCWEDVPPLKWPSWWGGRVEAPVGAGGMVVPSPQNTAEACISRQWCG